jgi:hypothetical protein
MSGLMARLASALFVIVALVGESAGAATLLNYEARVVRAAEQVKRIRADSFYEEEGVRTIRRLLPESEQVQVEGSAVTVDNNWLRKATSRRGSLTFAKWKRNSAH